MVNERNSNYELMRIVAMLAIVFDHLSVHGLPSLSSSILINNSINNYLLFSIPFDILGYIGNWIFIFISGWFLTGKSFSWGKLGKLWVQICSISFIITIIVYFSKIDIINYFDKDHFILNGFDATAKKITKNSFIMSLFPFYFSSNWYGSAYTIFYIFLPYLDKIISGLSKREHKNFALLLVILSQVSMAPGESIFNPSNVIVFFTGYSLIKYVKIYDPKILNNKKRNLIIILSLFILHYGYKISCIFFARKFNFSTAYFIWLSRLVDNISGFIPMMIALLFFCNFRTLEVRCNRVVNLISSTTFGIYLIHEHPLINYWLCNHIFKIYEHSVFVSYMSYVILYTFVTFVACMLLELLRKIIIDKPLFYFCDKTNRSNSEILNRVFSKNTPKSFISE